MKFTRVSNFYIELKNTDSAVIRIGKDFGSMGRSKALYFVELNDKVLQHGFGTQKEAKRWLAEYILKQQGAIV